MARTEGLEIQIQIYILWQEFVARYIPTLRHSRNICLHVATLISCAHNIPGQNLYIFIYASVYLQDFA